MARPRPTPGQRDEAVDHDQLVKEVVTVFFPDVMRLLVTKMARRLAVDQAREKDKELPKRKGRGTQRLTISTNPLPSLVGWRR